jgi:hypothetical protein
MSQKNKKSPECDFLATQWTAGGKVNFGQS